MTSPTIHTRCLICEKEVIRNCRRIFHPPALNNHGARDFFIRFVKPSFVFPPNEDDSLILFVCRKPCFSKLEQGAARVTAVESIIRELSDSPDATLVLSSRHTPSAGGVGVAGEAQPQTLSSEAPRPITASVSISGAVKSSVSATQSVPGPSQRRQLPNGSSIHTAVCETSAIARLGKRRLHGGSDPRITIRDFKRLRVADPLILFTPLLGQLAGGHLPMAAPLLGHHVGGQQSTAAPLPAIRPGPQRKEGSGSQVCGRPIIALEMAKPTPQGSSLFVPHEGGGRQSTATPVHISQSPRVKEGGHMSGRDIALANAKPTPQGASEQPVATLPSAAGTSTTGSGNTCGPILVTQVHGKSVRKFLVPIPYRRLVASIRYRKPEYTARTIMKTPRLKEAIVPEIAKHIQAECSSLCAMLPQPSVLRVQSINHLKEFHWDLIINELKLKAPTLLAILIAAAHPCRRAKQQDLNTHVVAMAAAVLLKQRSSHLCLPQTIVGTILHSGHTAKKVFGRLSKLGVCVTYESASRTVKALGISKNDPASGLKCEQKTPGWTLPCLSLLTGPATTSTSDPKMEHPLAASPSSGNSTPPVLEEDQPADISELDHEADLPADISELDHEVDLPADISELNHEEDFPADISELDHEEDLPADISDDNVEMFYDSVQVDHQ